MIQNRRALLAAFIVSSSAIPADAGCFDWLFNKHATPALPLAAGTLPPTTITPLGPPVAVGAPIFTSPGTVAPATGFVQPGMVNQGGFIQQGIPINGAPASVYSANFGGFNSPSALQMPAYNAFPVPINNPSVLTGMPVNPNAGPAPVSAFRTTINPALTNQFGSIPVQQHSYNAAAAFQSQNQLPAGVMAQPAFSPAPQNAHSSFFGSTLGNGYQTTYNNVPTTVFRPVQQIDPTTGQTVIVQQPCTTTTQQVQRTPYAALQPAPLPSTQPYYGEPTCGNEPPRYQSPGQFPPQSLSPTTNPYAPQGQYPPQGQYVPPSGYPSSGNLETGSGVVQTGANDYSNGAASGFSNNGYAPPIASTAPEPLQGYPATPSYNNAPAFNSAVPNGYQNSYPNGAANGSGLPSDSTPINQPQLNSTSRNHFYGPSSNELPTSAATPSTNVSSKYSDLPPIPASDEYRPPSWGGDSGSRAFRSDTLGPPPSKPLVSPPSSNDRTAYRVFEPNSPTQSARFVSQASPATPPPTSARNDSGWFSIGQ